MKNYLVEDYVFCSTFDVFTLIYCILYSLCGHTYWDRNVLYNLFVLVRLIPFTLLS